MDGRMGSDRLAENYPALKRWAIIVPACFSANRCRTAFTALETELLVEILIKSRASSDGGS